MRLREEKEAVERERHEAVLKCKNLEGQNLVLKKQVKYFSGGGPSQEESQVNVQIKKLLGIINRARRLNEAHRGERQVEEC